MPFKTGASLSLLFSGFSGAKQRALTEGTEVIAANARRKTFQLSRLGLNIDLRSFYFEQKEP